VANTTNDKVLKNSPIGMIIPIDRKCIVLGSAKSGSTLLDPVRFMATSTGPTVTLSLIRFIAISTLPVVRIRSKSEAI